VSNVEGYRAERPGLRRTREQPLLDPGAADDLLAGRPGVHASAAERAVGEVLDAARGPAREVELAQEAAYVATFVMATAPLTTPPFGSPPLAGPVAPADPAAVQDRHRRRGTLARLTVGAAATVLVVGASAGAGVLPPRLQELMHVTFGAPAPHHAGEFRPARHGVTTHPGQHGHHPAGQPAPTASKAPGTRSHAHAGTPKGAPAGQAKAKLTPPGQAKATPPGQAKATPPGQAKAKTTPPGQAKAKTTPPGQAKTTPPGHAETMATSPGHAKEGHAARPNGALRGHPSPRRPGHYMAAGLYR
jgi:hypothetical protein